MQVEEKIRNFKIGLEINKVAKQGNRNKRGYLYIPADICNSGH